MSNPPWLPNVRHLLHPNDCPPCVSKCLSPFTIRILSPLDYQMSFTFYTQMFVPPGYQMSVTFYTQMSVPHVFGKVTFYTFPSGSWNVCYPLHWNVCPPCVSKGPLHFTLRSLSPIDYQMSDPFYNHMSIPLCYQLYVIFYTMSVPPGLQNACHLLHSDVFLLFVSKCLSSFKS